MSEFQIQNIKTFLSKQTLLYLSHLPFVSLIFSMMDDRHFTDNFFCVCVWVCVFSDQVLSNTQRPGDNIHLCPVSHPLSCNPIKAHVFYLITHNYTSFSVSMSNSLYTQFDLLSTLMLTWLKLGWEEYRLWVRSEWLDTVHVESGLFCEEEKKQKKRSQDTVTLCPWQQRCVSGTADQLATCNANLLGELSAVSLADPEGSKYSCWPGNLRRSISQSSCSGPSPRRCNLFPSRRLLGDLDECSLCLEGLADSNSWLGGPEVRTIRLSGTATGPDNGLVSEFSILLGSNAEISIYLSIISKTFSIFLKNNQSMRWFQE